MKRKNLSGNQKFKIVLETFEKNNVAQIARKHEINPNLISNWRKIFLKHGGEIFAKNLDQEKNKMEKKIKQLEHLIGRKEIEISLLQNFLDDRQS